MSEAEVSNRCRHMCDDVHVCDYVHMCDYVHINSHACALLDLQRDKGVGVGWWRRESECLCVHANIH